MVLLAMSYKHMLMIIIIHFFVKGCTISWLITTTAVIRTSITCTVLSYLCSWTEACYLISFLCNEWGSIATNDNTLRYSGSWVASVQDFNLHRSSELLCSDVLITELLLWQSGCCGKSCVCGYNASLYSVVSWMLHGHS